ncbi:Uncharacterised protein [Vibrio cholerae]|nr:Uncharacterised protein [Vibrio cholerae]
MLCCVREANARTSSATTAKPLPCSPARAASIAALSASRLVCSAIAPMTCNTELICFVSSLIRVIVSAIEETWFTSPLTLLTASVTVCFDSSA